MVFVLFCHGCAIRFIGLAIRQIENVRCCCVAQSQFRVAHLYGIGTRGRSIKPRIEIESNGTETLLCCLPQPKHTFSNQRIVLSAIFGQQRLFCRLNAC